MMTEYFKTGKYITQVLSVIQGLFTIIVGLGGRDINVRTALIFTILWVAGFYILSISPQKARYRGLNYKNVSLVIFAIFGIWMAVAFETPVVLCMYVFLQWLTNLLFIDTKHCRRIMWIYICIFTIFTFTPGFDNISHLEYLGIILSLILVNWASKEILHIIENQIQMNEEQSRSIDDMLTIVDAKFEEAKLANKAKGSFLANMSHEIRTPINTVLGLDTMILRESSEAEIKNYAINIQSASRSLLSIINDILDFSKIESGKMEIIPVEYDVASLINDEINMISNKAKDKGLDFIIDVDEDLPVKLFGDDVRIRQVLTNLLTNAVKYTPEGSVTLSIKCKRDGDMAHIHYSVKDTGIGIKEEDLQKLFEEFVRIEEKRNRNIEGTGLGINIVTSMLNLMGSKLQVYSTYGEGSDFCFDLDQRIIEAEAIGDFAERIKQASEEYVYEASFIAPDAKLLVIDDNSMNLVVFRNLLKDIGCEIDEGLSGQEAIEMVQKKKYDIVFLDHMMPGMDGIETLHEIKKLSPEVNMCYDSPIIILTANAVSGAKEMYLEEGFDDFLSKPIIPEKLEAMISGKLPKELLKKPDPSQKKVKKEETNKPDFDIDALPKVDGVDWHYGYMHLPSEKMLLDTVKMFTMTLDSEADYLGEQYNNLITDASDEALELFRVKVHAMKSTATLFGALPIAGMAATLEFAARDKNIDLITDVTPHFLLQWRGYKDKFAVLFEEENSSEKKEVTDKNIIAELLDKLSDAAMCFDVHTADDTVAELRSYSFNEEITGLLNQISTAVMNLDVDTVSSLCGQIKEIL